MRHLDKSTMLSALLSLLLGSAAAAATGADQMLIYGDGLLSRTPLPAGPPAPALAAADGIGRILVLPSGQVLATTVESAGGASHPVLHELMPDGTLRLIAGLPGYLVSGLATVLDLELDPRGDLHVLTRFQNGYPPWDNVQDIVVDPATGALQGDPQHTVMVALAAGPEGLWGVDRGFNLRKYVPALGAHGAPILNLTALGFGMASGLEADSAGRLYFRRESACPPPCSELVRIDLGTGSATDAPPAIYGDLTLGAFTIQRFCQETGNAICLQQGRFRAEATYAAYDGAAGPAIVAPFRSSDTGIFYFFRPDNWESMVKVLDGCAINEHFWVYAAASTDVEYAMTITDTQTGLQKTYRNPLGHVAETVTDNLAFPCAP